MTINARNLELMVRRFASSRYSEVQQIGQEIYRLAKEVAPSIILFTEANDYDSKTYEELAKFRKLEAKRGMQKNLVTLEDYSRDADDMVIASLLHTVSKASFTDCRKAASKMTAARKKEIIKAACKRMEFYDAMLREFEFANLTFDLVISASCFAQLKRHRTATITTQDYDPSLGVTVPQAFYDAGIAKEFKEILHRTEDLYYEMEPKLGVFAQYILTNAHRRRVLLGVNARELYHISRLREDAHAQWDIMEVSTEMSKLAKKEMPLTFMLIGGKDRYPELYKKVYGVPPKLTPPK
jgi:thymidylate synthase ThyX